jgi:phosphate transport system substrate-binding protein
MNHEGTGTAGPTRVLVLLIAGALIVGCGEPMATPEPVFLTATGSTSMSPLVSDLAAAFTEQAPRINITVTGSGSQYGLDALYAGRSDIALVSWLPAGLGTGWRATAIARDGIAVIVHPSNPVEGLGLLQIQDLFSGRAYEWAAVGGLSAQGPAQPVIREEGSGTAAAFEALVMEGQRITPRAIVAPSSQAVVDYVAQHANSIGYVSMAYGSPQVRALKVEGEFPTPETASRGSYALSRELWLVTADPVPEPVQQFLAFALSPAGQEIAAKRYGKIR